MSLLGRLRFQLFDEDELDEVDGSEKEKLSELEELEEESGRVVEEVGKSLLLESNESDEMDDIEPAFNFAAFSSPFSSVVKNGFSSRKKVSD